MAVYRETLRYTKTVELYLEVSDCRVVSLRINGDFFVYPEDAVDRAEEKARGCSSVDCLEQALSIINEARVLGFDPSDLSSRIINAFKSLCKESSNS